MKRPSFQFYPGDWMKDPALSMCSPATRGIWIDVLCAMHELAGAELTGTAEQLARICRCTPADIEAAVDEMSVTRNADVTRDNGKITLRSRRLERERKASDNNRLRQRRYRGKQRDNDSDDEKVTPPSSSSLSSSSSEKAKARVDVDETFDRFWQVYPEKKGKGHAVRAWLKLAPDEALTDTIIAAIEVQKRERAEAKRHGEFVPTWKYPATWLNGVCWEDESTSRPADTGAPTMGGVYV